MKFAAVIVKFVAIQIESLHPEEEFIISVAVLLYSIKAVQ